MTIADSGVDGDQDWGPDVRVFDRTLQQCSRGRGRLRFQSQEVESRELWPVTLFDGWSHAPWLNSWVRLSSAPQPPSSMRCRPTERV